MIKLSALSFQKGSKVLLNDSELSIFPSWKVGLIGENGAGKSSLFELLQHPELADSGDCKLPKGWQIAHLKQEVQAEAKKAIEYVIDGHQVYRKLQAQIELAEAENDMHKLSQLHANMDEIHAYQIETQAATLLSGLGFTNQQQQKNVNEFSGGWRIRLNLAQTLMMPSDLLLLDEPTNHLDLDSILWLENFLSRYSGTMIIISHDREFLDNCVEYIVHIKNQSLETYTGNYSQFELQVAEREAQQASQFEKQQKQIEHMESFIRRFKAKATKAKQAQSRVKALERMELILPAHQHSAFQFQFYNHEKLPNSLIRLSEANLGYKHQSTEDTLILKNVNLELTPDSRIGIIGLNGSGKSTLLKSLIGDSPCLTGEHFQHEHCDIGYFSQHQLEALDLEASPLTHLIRLSPRTPESEMRKFLGSFGFHGDDVKEKITHFSGGEKSRLALSLICWKKPNVLILDEPTNHLDIEMRHALNLALQAFSGALILVSHDRHLVRCTTNDLFLINDGKCELFNGDIDHYTEYLSKGSDETPNKESSSASTNTENSKEQKKEQKKREAELRAKSSPLKKKLKSIENDLARLQTKNDTFETLLSDNTLYDTENKNKLKTLLLDQSTVKADIDLKEEAWLDISDQIEVLLNEANQD